MKAASISFLYAALVAERQTEKWLMELIRGPLKANVENSVTLMS